MPMLWKSIVGFEESSPTADEIMDIIAKKHNMGKLVTGHSVSLFKEAMIEHTRIHIKANNIFKKGVKIVNGCMFMWSNENQ